MHQVSRELPDWIDGYLEFTKGSEPPTIYHHWGALCVIAGALQRKVHLKMGFEKIYPNMYVILVGHSGRTRKGVALAIANQMLGTVSTVAIAPESSSREAIILAMKRASQNLEDMETGEITRHCSLTAFPEELAVLLGQGDIKLLANLTDWYNSKDSWSYETVGRGRDELNGVCLNLMGATAPDWIQSMLPQEAVGGGFTSRVVFVVAERKRDTVAEYELSEEEIELQGKLIRDLQHIAQMNGRFTFEGPGREKYNAWYKEQDKLLSDGKPAVEDRRFAGYCERRATHIRKLMMLMSVSRGSDMCILENDFDRSLNILLQTEAKMHKTFGGLGTAVHADATEKIRTYIKAMGITTRSQLLAKFYHDVDSITLVQIEQTLQQLKDVSIKLMPQDGEKVYTWIGKKD